MSFQMQNGRYRKMKWDNVIWGMLLIPVIDILMCLEINMILFMKFVISTSLIDKDLPTQ